MKHIIAQYWGWFLAYIILVLIGFYIVHWLDKQGKLSGDLSFEHMLCIFWPITFTAFIATAIAVLLRDVMIHVISWIDLLIPIIARRKTHSDETGELWRSFAPNIEHYTQWVKVKDKTGIHWIQVPLSIKTAREGVAWTYSLKENEYHPIVRT